MKNLMDFFLRKTLYLILIFIAILFIIECAFRVIYQNGAPLLPYFYDDIGTPQLPQNLNLTVRFNGDEAHQYITDEIGRRVLAPTKNDLPKEFTIRTFGDSQALGYGLDFQETFTYLLASSFPMKYSYIWGSPAIDVEQIANKICRSGIPSDETSELDILVVNIGNDLDEMYVAGQGLRGFGGADLNSWLLQHSYAFMHWSLISTQSRIQKNTIPGINFILYSMNSAERVIIAHEAVNRVIEFKNCVKSKNFIVVLIPSDFQIDVNELDKYAQYATPNSEYFQWMKDKQKAADMMNVLDKYMVSELRQHKIKVISLLEQHQKHSFSSAGMFSSQSHHLTVKGHSILADLIKQQEQM